MSLSSAIDQNNPNADYKGKFYPDLIPWEHPEAQQNLGQVLAVGNQALNPTTGLPQDATDFNILGCISIQTGKVYQGNNPDLEIGEVGDTLKVVGAITKGSILVGNGVETKELPVGANGLVLKANSGATYGVEWGTDASGGTVMAVNAGDNIIVSGTIAQPIVNVSNPIFVQKVNAPNTTNISLSASLGGEQSNLIMNAINATTGITTQSSLGADDSVGGNGGSVKVILTDPAVSSTSVLGQVLSTTATHETKWLNNVITSDYASNLVQSEANQTKLRCEVIDTAGQVNSVREDITLAGVMLDTHTGTQLGTNIVAQRIEQVGYTLGCNQVLQYTNPASIQATQTQQTSSLGATYQGITEDFPFGALHKGAFGLSSTNAQGEVSTLYEDFTVGAVYQGVGNMICNAGGSVMTVQSSNVSTGNSKLLRMETPASGDALIEHIAFGGSNLGLTSTQNLFITADNIDLSTAGRLILPSLSSADRLDYNAGTLALKTDNVGYTTDDLLLLENTNATAGNTTGVPSLEFYKSGRNGAINDVVSTILFNAKDGAGVKRTFGKIESTITTNTAPLNYDGALDFYSLINGVNNLVFRLNGADNENNSFRPLDLNGNDLKTSTGDMLITSTASTGTGNIGINAKGSITLTPVAGSNLLNGNTTVQASKTLSLSKSATIVSTQVLNGESLVNTDSTNSITATLDTSKLVILDTPNNSYGDYRKNYIAVFDNANNQNIQIDNQTATQNRVDFFVNSGSGITTTAGIVNNPSNQSVFMNHQDNANGRSLQLVNDSASGGVLNYTNQISPLQPFTIDSSTGELILKTIAGQALTLNSDILNLANTNTTTTANAHNADIRTTSSGVSTNTFLKLQLNGTDIWVPYFTTDPSL